MHGADSNLSISSLFDVTGKVALVTGGGSGLGAIIAEALVQNGAKVYIASRKEKQLKDVSDSLNVLKPGSCHYIVADISSKAGCDALATSLKQKESKLHILFNNSGATWGAPWGETREEKTGWDRVMNLNVKALFYLTSALTDLLAKDSHAEDPARVLNISSIASWSAQAEGSPMAVKGNGTWAYNTSKAAVNHLTTLMAVTLAPKFITVNAILPGVFPSRMSAFGVNKALETLRASHPMGRLGSRRDMAGVALFLVSPASKHITGAMVLVDGGLLITTGGILGHSARL